MKAWNLFDPYDYEGRTQIVFADNHNEAKAQAGFFDIDCPWIQLKALRAKEFDDMEELTQKEFMRKQWENGWWFEYGADRLLSYDDEDSTESAFDEWWNRTYGLEEKERKNGN